MMNRTTLNRPIGLLRRAALLLALPALIAPAVARASAGGQAASSFQEPPESTSGRYIFTFQKDLQYVESLARTLAYQGKGTLRCVYQHALKGCAIDGLTAETAASLACLPGVTGVEPDFICMPLSMQQADAPYYLDRIDQRDLPMDGVYNYEATGAGVTAYVIDSGIIINDEEFLDGAGVSRASYGYDFGSNDEVAENPFGYYGHGAKVARRLGGSSSGVAKGVSIVALKICSDDNEWGVLSAIELAIDWVTARVKTTPHPAVINLSYIAYGGSGSLDQAAQGAIDQGITFCCGAGNIGDGSKRPTPPGGWFGGVDPSEPGDVYASNHSPGRVPAVMTIGASDQGDGEAWYSCYGIAIDLLAPSESGTSFSSPLVAGAVALCLEGHPTASPLEVDQAIKDMATPDRIINMKDPNMTTPNLLLYTGSASLPSPSPTPTLPPIPTSTPEPSPLPEDGGGGCRAGTGSGTLAPLLLGLLFLVLRRMRPFVVPAFLALAVAAWPAEALAQAWSEPSGAPLPVHLGGRVVSTGPDTLFVTTGVREAANSRDVIDDTSTPFYRYTVSSLQWDRMADIPAVVHSAGAMAHPPGTNHIYLYPATYLRGQMDRTSFYRYTLPDLVDLDGEWERLSDLPAPLSVDNSLTATATHLYYHSTSYPAITARFFEGNTWWPAAYGDHFYKFDLQSDPPSWSPLPNFYFTRQDRYDRGSPWVTYTAVTPGGNSACIVGDYLYRIRGPYMEIGGVGTIDRYHIPTDSWDNGYPLQSVYVQTYPPAYITRLPEDAGANGLIAGPAGSNTLYTVAGQYPGDYGYGLATLCRLDIDAENSNGGIWKILAQPPTMGFDTTAAGEDLFFLRTGWNKELYRYSVSRERFLSNLEWAPGWIGSGGCLAAVGNGTDLFALQGSAGTSSGRRGFYHYSLETGHWTPRSDIPTNVGNGGSLAYDGQGGMIAAVMNSPSTWRYDIAADEWAEADPWAQMDPSISWSGMGCGGQLLPVGGGRIYAMRGNARASLNTAPTKDFWLLDPSFVPAPPEEPHWQARASLPGTDSFFFGSSLAFDPVDDEIYAFTGVMQSDKRFITMFRRYSISRDEWSDPLATPPATDTGAALCHPGYGREIYALAGGGSDTFAVYDIEANAWNSMPDAPGMVGIVRTPTSVSTLGGGGALVHPGCLSTQFFAFQGINSSAFWSYDTSNPANAAPVPGHVAQWKLNGIDPIVDGVTFETGLVVTAMTVDQDGDYAKLQIQVRETGVDFSDDVPDPGTPNPFVPSGTVSSVTRTGLALDRSYHWRVRAFDVRGKASEWVHFGSEESGEVDLHTRSNTAPTLASLLQRDLRSDEILEAGTRVFGGSGVRFQAYSDDEHGDALRLEIEVRPWDVPLTGAATHAGPLVSGGWTPEIIVDLPPGSYHWQARAVDSFEAARDWTAFGAGLRPDFELVLNYGSKNDPGCLSSSSALSWGGATEDRSAGGGSFLLALFAIVLVSKFRLSV